MEHDANIAVRDSVPADGSTATPSGGVPETLQQIERHLAAIRDQLQAAPREWLTVEEAAQELRVSRDTVERAISAGHLKAIQIATTNGRGRRFRYRVRRAWIDDFCLQHVKSGAVVKASRRKRRTRPLVDFIG
jgi:excisionase family DNA binding protein